LEILEKLRLMMPKQKVHLYQHMHMDEESQHARVGWKLDELAWRYGLKPNEDVRWRGRQFSEQEMVDVVYAAADAVISTSAGEGFQYPIWEALACGRRVVAPAGSARKAWLSHTPGVFLYKADEHGEVVRGGYNRRMARGDLADACRILKKMVEGKEKHRETSEASRSWVARTADVEMVKTWWVNQMDKLDRELEAERASQGFTVHGSPDTDHVISVRAGPGLGDFLMMLPAFAAFARDHVGDSTCLAVPRNDAHVELAMLFNPFDTIQMDDRVPLEKLGRRVHDLSTLWTPLHTGGWSDPKVHRTDAVAARLGVADLQKLPAIPAEKHIKATTAHFVQRFGVHPSKCVVIAGQSHNPARTLPEAYMLTVAEQVINMGLVPVLAGTQRAACQRVGILNLTQQTDFGGLVGLLGAARAAVCIDSAPLHIAAIQGTPTVALMPLFSADTRLSYYSGEIIAVEPACKELNGETFPAGKDGAEAWVSELDPPRIVAALRQLLGEAADDGPRIITPEDVK